MTRGILYITWPGDPRTETAIDRSIESIQAVHPELPFQISELPEGANLLDKALMRDLSPYDETLYLDVDTVVLERLDFGFERASQFGLACCICECPWGRRFKGIQDRGDIIEYNTGVVFFSKDCPVFESWKTHAEAMDSSLQFVGPNGPDTMPYNDQAGFALAVSETGFNPFILPLNWNFRPIWHKHTFGPIKIWHDYKPVPQSVRDWNLKQTAPNAIIEYVGVA